MPCPGEPDFAKEGHQVCHVHRERDIGALGNSIDKLNRGPCSHPGDVDGVFLHTAQDLFDATCLPFKAGSAEAFLIPALKDEGGVTLIDIDKEVHDFGEAERCESFIGSGRKYGQAQSAFGPEFQSGLGVIGIVFDLDIAPEWHEDIRGVICKIADVFHVPQIKDGEGAEEA